MVLAYKLLQFISLVPPLPQLGMCHCLCNLGPLWYLARESIKLPTSVRDHQWLWIFSESKYLFRFVAQWKLFFATFLFRLKVLSEKIFLAHVSGRSRVVFAGGWGGGAKVGLAEGDVRTTGRGLEARSFYGGPGACLLVQILAFLDLGQLFFLCIEAF